MNLLGILMEAVASQSMDTIKTALIRLLRAAWIAGILPLLIASLPSPRLNPFHSLLQAYAKRGKIMPSSSNRFTVPQSFFLHFYLLGLVWTTTLLMGIWYFAYKVAPLGSEPLSFVSQLTGGSHVFFLHKSRFTTAEARFNVWKSVFLLLLMEIHVLRRLYETRHVFNYSSSARMHIVGYLTGIYYYTAAPLSLCTFCALEAFNFAADQVVEFKVEGQEMLSITDFDLWGYVKPITGLGRCQWAGASIFAWGWFHQFCCHAILGSLRERGDRTAEYIIPRGDWFEVVSSPHYLAEMIIYAGLLVASGGTDITIWLLLGFVVANLAFSAAETHRWYLQKFEDYPRNRWAILPFVY
ncbi:Polyprenol reductase 1 [Hibiscus syriacus]|uniref:Polyprenol reductase 1 n=1 Tax=Hibiscus syriacus TaxID=106335 RepID=A0A6A3BHL0_HIBSY|nr:polyprenol reductase 2-like [Hibiscus syriacus]KAE8715665.1 Polyprenol reductase 1 [Hibiscus syriacus]